MAWAVSLLRGVFSSPRAFFFAAIFVAVAVAGCEIDKRATHRERAKWVERVAAAEAQVRAAQADATAKIADAINAAERINREAIDAQLKDTETLRAELAQAGNALARCRVPRAVVVRLDAGARALPGSAAAAGVDRSRADPAVSRVDGFSADRAPGQPAPGAPAQAAPEPTVDAAAVLIRAREVSGAAERNTERLVACIAAYNAAREAAVSVGRGAR